MIKFTPHTGLKKGFVIMLVAVFAIVATLLLRPSGAAPGPADGDINDDGVVNILDLSQLLSNWGSTSAQADINDDGIVNILDLSSLLSQWGDRVVGDADITVMPSDVTGTFDKRLLGINVPSWLNGTWLSDSDVLQLGQELDSHLIRLPGGSWSNYYDWLACERDGVGIDGGAVCHWTWAAKPSEFIPIIQATNSEVIWTVNQNNTPQEAAALVAFFNGSTSDNTAIGVDRNGNNWLSVGHWAQLRVDAGYASPVTVRYWEVGNEIYGGKNGTDCAPWGWESVWTCDGREYVNGVNGNEGFLDFAAAMKAVDPTIELGGVGVRNPAGWSNFGNEVIEEAGSELDFYVVHNYHWNTPPANTAEFMAAVTNTWQQPMDTLRSALLPTTEVAVTEYNAAAFLNGDTNDVMSRVANGIHIAETVGEMALSGVDMATHWVFGHGGSGAPSAYGLIDIDGNRRTPQYWSMALWARMGEQFVEVSTDLDPASEVRVFATKDTSGDIRLLILNKQSSATQKSIAVPGALSANLLSASATDPNDLNFRVNGSTTPAVDIESIERTPLGVDSGVVTINLEPTSISLVHIER